MNINKRYLELTSLLERASEDALDSIKASHFNLAKFNISPDDFGKEVENIRTQTFKLSFIDRLINITESDGCKSAVAYMLFLKYQLEAKNQHPYSEVVAVVKMLSTILANIEA